MNPKLHTDTALAKALAAIFQRLEKEIGLDTAVNVYLAGGIAVHLYTGIRVTTDIDAEFSRRTVIPAKLATSITFEDGTQSYLYLDGNYNSTLGMMHENYIHDAIPVDLGTGKFSLHVLSPLDLVVSKISRLADNDKEDIAALTRAGLISADALEKRITEARDYYVGNPGFLKHNIRDAIEIARKTEVASKGNEPSLVWRRPISKRSRGGPEL